MTTADILRARFPQRSYAEFSVDRLHRYILCRIGDYAGPLLGYVGLNPSIAAEVTNDATTTRNDIRARRHGFKGVVMGNAYAFCATNPRNLWKAADPKGPDNDRYLREIGELCPTIVLAWGAHVEPDRANAIVRLYREMPKPPRLVHLGLTKGGQPRHPLYLAYDTPLQDLPADWTANAALARLDSETDTQRHPDDVSQERYAYED